MASDARLSRARERDSYGLFSKTFAVFRRKLSKEQLGLGVMLGRGGQCIQAGVDPMLDVSISRTHLLLLFHGGIYEAFDICSTQGTSMGGRRIVRQVLPLTATLQMASIDPIVVHWRVEGEAR
jgi:hypothetical protein